MYYYYYYIFHEKLPFSYLIIIPCLEDRTFYKNYLFVNSF